MVIDGNKIKSIYDSIAYFTEGKFFYPKTDRAAGKYYQIDLMFMSLWGGGYPSLTQECEREIQSKLKRKAMVKR